MSEKVCGADRSFTSLGRIQEIGILVPNHGIKQVSISATITQASLDLQII